MFRVVLCWLILYILLETIIKEKTEYLSENYANELVLNNNNGNYICHYAQLACGCYSKYGGCGVKCSPTYSYTLYNQTSCPKLKDHFLAGFE